MNNKGELSFFASSTADGLSLIASDGRPLTSSLAHLPREIVEASSRRVSWKILEGLDHDCR